ncbi:PAS domain S-box protein [candidate division WOR-3 bacterium]|nr:PAS domain S-box protein [candidate division WOR-3 bacterium]
MHEEFYSFFQFHPEPIYILNKEGKVIDINSEAIKKSGFSRDEIVGISIEKIFSTPKPRKISTKKFIELFKKEYNNAELKLICKDGSTINVNCSTTILKNNEKEIEQIILITHDITKFKQIEEALTFESRLLHSLLETIPDSIYFKDRDSHFIEVSKAKANELGCMEVEVIGKTDFDFHPEEEAMEEFKDEQRIMEKEEPIIDKEEKVINPDGTTWWASTTKVPRYDDNGNVIGTLGISRNITDRIQAEKKLEETAKKFRAIVNSISEGLAIVDRDFIVKEINKYLLDLFGLKRDEVVGSKCYQVFHSYENVCDECPAQSTFENGEVSHIERSEGSKKGELRFFDFYAHPILNDKRNVIQAVISISDITNRKRTEVEKIFNYQKKLRNLSHKLILAEEHERKRIATALHAEVGQNLALLKLKIGELRKRKSHTETIKSLKEIYDLVQQAIISTRSLMYQISPTILYELGFVPAIDWLTERILKRNGIYCDFDDDGMKKPLNDDIRVLLFQAVQELLINIRKHAQARKAVVSIKKEDKNILIKVSDDGIAFDTSKLDSYIDENVGFGLLNIRERLDMIGGSFEIKSKPEYGTIITLKAPLEIYNNQK